MYKVSTIHKNLDIKLIKKNKLTEAFTVLTCIWDTKSRILKSQGCIRAETFESSNEQKVTTK